MIMAGRSRQQKQAPRRKVVKFYRCQHQGLLLLLVSLIGVSVFLMLNMSLDRGTGGIPSSETEGVWGLPPRSEHLMLQVEDELDRLSPSFSARNDNFTTDTITSQVEDCFHARAFDFSSSNGNLSSIPALPKPWIHIGLPKTGTTTLEMFWKCGLNLGTRDDYVSHSTCKVSSESLRTLAFEGRGIPKNPTRQCPSKRVAPCEFCGECMYKAQNLSLPLLESCGNYQAWAQMDVARGCFYPQLHYLDKIHQEVPHATFVFMFRTVDKWIQSVRNFRKGELLTYLKKRCFRRYWKKNDGRILVGGEKDDDYEALKQVFCSAVNHARNFVAQHPTHAYLEINLDDPASSRLASQAFGIVESCWGMHNVNTKIHELSAAAGGS